MFKRKINSELDAWSRKPQKKALLVKGARQVGKTTSIRQFAASHYKHFVEINFEQTPLAHRAFEGNLDAQTVINNLSVMGFGPFVPGETLVFFDEIQSCPQARTAIKFLVEDGRFDYIESGSLLGINYGEVSSYPVGFEHQINMYPLDFEEFLWACNVSCDVVDNLRAAFENLHPVGDFIHEQMMMRLRQYLIVGGMPEVVAKFLDNPDFGFTLDVQRDIVNSYRDDISKYAGKEKNLAKNIFDTIPQQLSKQDKRFVLAHLEEHASIRKYGAPSQWLADAGIAYFSKNVRALEQPLSVFVKQNLFKLYMLDTGLLCSMMLNNIQAALLQGNISINEGAVTENFVAAELLKHGHTPYYYDHKSRLELDFVFDGEDGIHVIEVKSGKDYTRHSSLDAALRMYPNNLKRSMVMANCNVQNDGLITYLPLYMIMFV